MKDYVEFNGKFSLCDSMITAVETTKKYVNFVFGEGLLYLEGQSFSERSKPVKISIEKDLFDCEIIYSKRMNFVRGEEPVYVSRVIELEHMIELMRDGARIEVFDEIYDENRLFWRCALHWHEEGVYVNKWEELLIIHYFEDKIDFKVFIYER